jgi:hypothetical protein
MDKQPPLHVILDVVEAGAHIQRLLHLDRAWTAAGDRGSECSDRDREALVALANRIDTHIAASERHARALREVFDSYPDWVNERVRGEITSNHFTPAQQDGIKRLLAAEKENYASRGAAVADFIAQRAPAEREELRSKVPALRGNGPVVTDMSHEMFCSMAVSGIVADLAVCPETLGVGCAAALAVYLIADSEGC